MPGEALSAEKKTAQRKIDALAHHPWSTPLPHRSAHQWMPPGNTSWYTAKPESHGTVVGAIDPFNGDDTQLKSTCEALPVVLKGRSSPITRERAGDALAHGCKGRP